MAVTSQSVLEALRELDEEVRHWPKKAKLEDVKEEVKDEAKHEVKQ